MKEYFITWNCGYGESYDVVEAESVEKAEEMAYDSWKEEAEHNAKYAATVLTDQIKEDYSL